MAKEISEVIEETPRLEEFLSEVEKLKEGEEGYMTTNVQLTGNPYYCKVLVRAFEEFPDLDQLGALDQCLDDQLYVKVEQEDEKLVLAQILGDDVKPVGMKFRQEINGYQELGRLYIIK